MFDVAYEVGAVTTIVNRQGLTTLTLAALMANRQMFMHILNINRDVYWRVGKVPMMDSSNFLVNPLPNFGNECKHLRECVCISEQEVHAQFYIFYNLKLTSFAQPQNQCLLLLIYKKLPTYTLDGFDLTRPLRQGFQQIVLNLMISYEFICAFVKGIFFYLKTISGPILI
jgi:hypothetical protein